MILRNPRRVLAGALLCVLVLGVLGFRVEDRLVPVSPTMPGSGSARAEKQLDRYFGDSAPFTVLLHGPASELDQQGPRLIRALKRDSAVTTLSPWDRGAVEGLRPSPRQAIVLVDFHHRIEDAVESDVIHLNELLDRQIVSPVMATESSYPSFLRGVKESSNDAAKQAETIVLPVLLLVLLLVFRSPLAALVPLILGACTVVAARGILSVLTTGVGIDAFALPVSAMIGLALGVDYTLLMVSRYREELATGKSAMAAAAATRRTAGRTVVGAGGTLFVSLSIVFFLVPGSLFRSVVGSMILVTALSVGFALVVAPAALTLLGENVNRWSVGLPIKARPFWMAWVDAALRHPGVTALAISALLLLLASPALSLNLGPSGLAQLPSNSSVREDAALVDRLVGPGWSTPFVVVASTETGSIGDPGRLAAISRWQRRVAARPDVQAVIGPGQIANKVAPLRESAEGLFGEPADKRIGRSEQLASKLEQAADGVSRLRDGLGAASDGAGLLGEGSSRAAAGADAIAGGLRRASDGAVKGQEATAKMAAGSKRLVDGQRALRFGALEVNLGLQDLLPTVAREGLGVARPLEADLSRLAGKYPELQGDLERAERLVVQLEKAKAEVIRLRRISGKVHGGLGTLTEGGERLHDGAEQLSAASEELGTGLNRLGAGSDELAAGLSRLAGGAGALEDNLADGADRTSGLQAGLRRGSVAVSDESDDLRGQIGQLQRQSPHIFNSGHFVLSALDGAPAGQRRSIGQAIDLDGGQAARMLVVSTQELSSPGSRKLYSDLRDEADLLERDSRTTVGITGGEPQLSDFADIAKKRFPLSVLAITLATFLMLVVILRAVLLSAIAVLLNLVSVAVAFGVLALIAQIPEGYPLGGHEVVDVTGATAIFTVAFGLSIDYAVFLLMRMRESFDQDADHRAAIALGVESTGRVISGAAAVMAVVFIAFAAVPVTFLSQMGIGLAVAILVDATVVRLVLLPTIMLALGDRVWRLPRRLDGLLPRMRTH